MSTLLFEGSLNGANIEVGTATMGAGNTVEVTTKLSSIDAATATYSEAPGAATQMCCDKTISSGAVTFADAGVASKAFQYILVGLP